VHQSKSRSAVVLDRYPLWAEAVESVLERAAVSVVGSATSGKEALDLVERLRPDLLVTDIGASDGTSAGLACLSESRKRVPRIRGIVLAATEDRAEINAALRAGASAYVLKSAHPGDLASAVRQAFAHSVYFALPAEISSLNAARSASVVRAGLTKREAQILKLAAEGHSNATLARMLWVTEQTVKFHLSNVYRKLNVANRTEAARWAQVHGLVPTDDESAAA